MFVASDVSMIVSDRLKDKSRNSCDVCRDIIPGNTETKLGRNRRLSRPMFGRGKSQIQRWMTKHATASSDLKEKICKQAHTPFVRYKYR